MSTAPLKPRRVRPRVLTSIVLAAALSGVATSALAGGLYVNEFSTTAQANAGAGRGAWVPDASAALLNPATMTVLEDHSFATGFTIAAGNVEFDPAPSSPSGTSSGGNQAGVAPIASLNYVHRVSDRVRAGLSFYSVSGSILDPSNSWAGRFQMTEIALLTISISPTIAIEVTDWLSIGGGPIATYGSLDWDLRVDFPLGNENQLRLEEFDDWQAAGRVGLHLRPTDTLSFGLYYNSETDFDLSGSVSGPLGATPNLDVNLPLAQFVEASAAWQVNDRITLLATFNWEDWSAADDLTLTAGGVTRGATTGFRDTYKFGLGMNYQYDEKLLLQTGFMIDTSPLKNRDRIASLPIDQQFRIAAGFQYDVNASLTLGGSFVYVNFGQGEIRKPTVVGDFGDNDVFALGMTLAFKELPWSGRLTVD